MRRIIPPLVLALFLAATPAVGQQSDGFDHPQHAKVFPTCTACHAGAKDGTVALLPSGQGCVSCHDGTIQRRVNWTPPPPEATNLRFTHAEHRQGVRARTRADSTLACQACHTPQGAPWMTVERAVLPQCLGCHGVRTAHLEAPDTACATCHLTLAQATALSTADVKGFPIPPSHQAAGFMAAGGHGAQARAGTGSATYGVAPSCATCHAREFCITCHVDAPETPTIQSLASDPRSLAIPAELEAPASHAQGGFLTKIGRAHV